MSSYPSCAQAARQQLTSARPCTGLREGVWGYEGFHRPGSAPRERLHLPTTAVSLVLPLEGRLEPSAPAARMPAGAPLLAGPRTESLTLRYGAGARGVRVLLAPWAAHALTGGPMDRLAGRVVPAGELLGPLAGRLTAVLADAPHWAGSCALLDEALSRLLPGRPEPAPPVLRAWRALVRSRGTLPVAELAREAGWCRSQLGRRFQAQVGLTPKAVARVLRLREAVRLLGAGEPVATVAVAAGFHDQAHFAREFKAMTGHTPRRFLAEWDADGFRREHEEAEFLQEWLRVPAADCSSVR
ncbi:helix-turn-helix domain-containing protein [Streptomyces sp. NPDC101132]|uniref:helix-turn-helix domain-containing protein n=1 Tax=Streptomyces sp. NPDC101132 TaxID=3366110 RepID=UPI00380D5D92